MDKIVASLRMTAEMCGTEFTELAVMGIMQQLVTYDEKEVLMALDRCQREVTGRLSLAAILARLPSSERQPWDGAVGL